jgi:carbamoyl-phosphate synthase large subunit
MLQEVGVPATAVSKSDVPDGGAIELIEEGAVDLVINIPREYDRLGRPDGYLIRRRAVECSVPLFTDLQLARALIEALLATRGTPLVNRPLDSYFRPQ